MTDINAVDFELLAQQFDALTEGEADRLANSANFVALLANAMPDTNWTGIYVMRDGQLVLGPFQGNPGCVRIPLGKGVCGVAARQRKTQRVADVHAFSGHIACDPLSAAELVVPLMAGNEVIGVLDIDSPSVNRFSERDQRGVELLCRAFVARLQSDGPLTLPFI